MPRARGRGSIVVLITARSTAVVGGASGEASGELIATPLEQLGDGVGTGHNQRELSESHLNGVCFVYGEGSKVYGVRIPG